MESGGSWFFRNGVKKGFNFSKVWKPDRLNAMKKYLLLCLTSLTISAFAESTLPPAPQILSAVRSQLPSHPVVMNGTLKQRAANGFVKKTLAVEMELDWKAVPSRAKYVITDTKSDQTQTLDVVWKKSGAEYTFTQNGEKVEIDVNTEIQNVGVTWSDLSFSFLWDPKAETFGVEKKFGKERYEISIPRPNDHTLLLWIEKETGRMMKAEEYDADQKKKKIIKVVSVKEFDDIWMVKDLDIIRPQQGGRTSLRIDSVEAL
jgi:hypothetical protein